MFKKFLAELLVYWFPGLKNPLTPGEISLEHSRKISEALTTAHAKARQEWPRGRLVRYMVRVFNPGEPHSTFFFRSENTDRWIAVRETAEEHTVTLSAVFWPEDALPRNVKELIK